MGALFNFMTNMFAVFFGHIIRFLYGFTNNYVLTLILITMIMKLCLLPIEIYKTKQNKIKAETRAKIRAIKDKYPDDKWKANKEIRELRDETPEGIKGLRIITFFLQLFVLIGLLNVLNTPLTSILRIDETTIEKMEYVMEEKIEESGEKSRVQIVMMEEIENYRDILLSDGTLTEDTITKVLLLRGKFALFGINLSLKPQFNEPSVLWLFPLAFVLIMLVSAVYSLIKAWKNRGKLKGALAILDYLPIAISALYFFLFFMFPVGITFYFTVSNLLTFVQRIILSKAFHINKNNVTETTEIQPA